VVKAVIVYYSMFGNTKKIAESLAEGLRSGGVDSSVVKAEEVKIDELGEFDLLCVGSPVHAWNASKPIKEFLERLNAVSGLSGKKAFAFDTKAKSRLAGDASGKIERKLKALGFVVLKPHTSAIVLGREGPLDDGSESKFKQLGMEMAKSLQSL
jgi:flavorubredoxin